VSVWLPDEGKAFLERATFRADLASSQQAIPLLLSDNQHLLVMLKAFQTLNIATNKLLGSFGR
jgi:hypothetical protein